MSSSSPSTSVKIHYITKGSWEEMIKNAVEFINGSNLSNHSQLIDIVTSNTKTLGGHIRRHPYITSSFFFNFMACTPVPVIISSSLT